MKAYNQIHMLELKEVKSEGRKGYYGVGNNVKVHIRIHYHILDG